MISKRDRVLDRGSNNPTHGLAVNKAAYGYFIMRQALRFDIAHTPKFILDLKSHVNIQAESYAANNLNDLVNLKKSKCLGLGR